MSKLKLYLPLFISVATNTCNVYASAAAGNDPRECLSSSSSSSSTASSKTHAPRETVTPSCDPLVPEKDGAVYSLIKTPHKTLMGLDALYRRGLSGKGVRVGVIEFDGIPCNLPVLQGAIIELPGTKYNYDAGSTHWMLVSQVIASQQPDDSGG